MADSLDRTNELLAEILDGVNRIASPSETLEAVLGRQADATVRAAEIHAASWDRLSDAVRDQSAAMRENASAWRDGAVALRDVSAAIRDVGFRRPNGQAES
jgi:hypothetical protein